VRPAASCACGGWLRRPGVGPAPPNARRLTAAASAARAPLAPSQERIRRPLDDDKTFLQGVDHEGRAIVIVRVRNHFSSRRDLRQMRLFSAYIIDCLVRAYAGFGRTRAWGVKPGA
jgi:hypothetical protein